MVWAACCMSYNCLRAISTIASHYFIHVSDTLEYYSPLQGRSPKEGHGIVAFIQQLGTMLVYVFLNCICWSSAMAEAASNQEAGSPSSSFSTGWGNTGAEAGATSPHLPVCWLVLMCYTFGDLMDHMLLCRVSQLKFPPLYRNRGFWFLTAFWICIGQNTLVYGVTVLAVASH